MSSIILQDCVADPSRIVVVLTTWPADRDPGQLAEPLIDEQFVACVNVFPPMWSVYRWRGERQRESEHQIVMKTTWDRVAALRDRLSSIHPYEVPEFLVIEVAAGASTYLEWVRESAPNRSG